ncbi:SRPBCC family protein [uncultured Aquimarina sp.]|uniref:SRPBCC family protein n=1 Tax=uncultured Aquimarina sp. TaxID=575652 RepID=UPI00260A5F89|nr:SRPBCC family protein [uncultured Aquimarina sp.]
MSKKKIETSHLVNAPVEKVWANISKASGVHEWLPMIETCSLEGQGEGAKRVCTTENGVLNETILKIDHENKTFQYAIDEQTLFPISDIVGTMSVRNDKGKTILDWNLDFSLEDENIFSIIEQAIAGMYAAGAAGLEKTSN